MSKDNKDQLPTRRLNPWLVVGVVVLIILLFIWLTFADFTGDTDVAAAIAPLATIL